MKINWIPYAKTYTMMQSISKQTKSVRISLKRGSSPQEWLGTTNAGYGSPEEGLSYFAVGIRR